MNRTALTIAVCAVAVAAWVVAGATTPRELATIPPTGPATEAIVPVFVVNNPNPQNVAGVIDVGNLPAVHPVSGTVSVDNLPVDPSGNLMVTFAGDARPFRFVGVTIQSFQGDAGWQAMTMACNTQYPGARVAFTDEYRTTVNPPDIPAEAWIQPRPAVATRLIDGANHPFVFDATGFLFNSLEVDCDSWSNTFGKGGIITPAGVLTSDSCGVERPVACSAP